VSLLQNDEDAVAAGIAGAVLLEKVVLVSAVWLSLCLPLSWRLPAEAVETKQGLQVQGLADGVPAGVQRVRRS
jgi:hypothetical protein